MNKFYVSLLFVFIGGVLQAQPNPGGVGANLSLWLKADGLPVGTLNTWNYSNNTNSFSATTAPPTVALNQFNFLPAVSFGGAQFMTGPTGSGTPGAPIPLNSLAYSIFAVWSSTVPTTNGPMRVWAQRDPSNVNFNGAALWIETNAPS